MASEERGRIYPGKPAKAWFYETNEIDHVDHGGEYFKKYPADPAKDLEVQVRILRAAVNVIYGKDLASWVVDEIKAGRMKLEIRE